MFSGGRGKTLTNTSWGIPQMGQALKGWFQPMIFILVVKTEVLFKVEETLTEIKFMGVWQPYSAEQLALKPEGQRSWRWFTVHADPTLILKPDEKVTYKDLTYRVMQKQDYKEYDYVEYHLIEDYV